MSATDLVAQRATQIQPLDTQQTRAMMQTYQRGLEQIVDDSDRQEFKDRDGKTRRFLKRSGWRKIATWFGLDLQIVNREIDRDENGRITRTHVVARAIAPNGRYADGDGGCSAEERRFSKPEHDIPGVATTRATNRAISNLVGMGELSFEEMSADPDVDVRLAAPALISGARARELAAALQRQWPDLDGHEFLRVLRSSFVAKGVEGVPEAAAQALEGWVFWAGQPVAESDGTPETAPQAPLEGNTTNPQTEE